MRVFNFMNEKNNKNTNDKNNNGVLLIAGLAITTLTLALTQKEIREAGKKAIKVGLSSPLLPKEYNSPWAGLLFSGATGLIAKALERRLLKNA